MDSSQHIMLTQVIFPTIIMLCVKPAFSVKKKGCDKRHGYDYALALLHRHTYTLGGASHSRTSLTSSATTQLPTD